MTCESQADFSVIGIDCQRTFTATNNNSDAIHIWSSIGTITGQGNASVTVDYPSGNQTYIVLHIIQIPNSSGGFDTYSCSKEVAVNCDFNCTELFTISQSTQDCSIYQFTPSIAPANIVSYYWDFGDGSTSTAMSPSHQFVNGSSVSSVSLTVIDNNGVSQTCMETIYVDCLQTFCGEASTFSYQSENCKVTFYAVDLPQIVSSTWDFGDGTTQENATIVTHAYTQPGTYTITYTSTYDNGSGPVAFSCSRIVTVTCACCPNPASVSIGNTSLLHLISSGILPNTQVSNKEFCIDTKLLINASNYTFSNCTFNMAPGSEIVLTPGFGIGGSATVNIENSNFFGCTEMWKGIKTESGSALVFKGNIVSDAQYAINSRPGSKITIVDNHFDRNYISIRSEGAVKGEAYNNLHECTGDLLPSFTNQTPLPQTNRSLAGIQLLNSDKKIPIRIGIANSLVPAETFRNLHNGIIANESGINAGALRIENMIFHENISSISGTGVNAENCGLVAISGMDFSTNPSLPLANDLSKASFIRCEGSGIRIETSNEIIIRNNRMVDVNWAIWLEQNSRGSMIVQNNKISTSHTFLYQNIFNHGWGIYSGQNQLTSKLSINNNTIEIGEESLGNIGGRYGIAFDSNTAIPWLKHTIEQNNIYLYNEGYSSFSNTPFINGISATSDHLGILKNNIYLKNSIASTGLVGSSSGISYSGGFGTISCNKIHADLFLQNSSTRAISTENNNRGVYQCNDLKNTNIGLGFNGISMNAEINTNTFNQHQTGLLMDNFTIVSGVGNAHQHGGNLWTGNAPTGGFEARHNGQPNNIQLSRFFIHTSSGDFFPSPISTPLGNQGDWFILQFGTPDICHPINSCTQNGIGLISPLSPMEEAVINETPLTTDFVQPILWEASRDVYDRLKEDPGLINSSSQVSNFYSLHSTSSIGGFWELEKRMNDLYPLSESETDQVLNYSNQLENLIDQIGQKTIEMKSSSGSMLTNLTNQRDELIHDFDSIYIQQQMLFQVRSTAMLLLADSLAIQNEAITTSGTIYEENQKTVHAIYLATIAKNLSEFTPQQITDLWYVANQCPHAGGRAVHQARAIYKLIDASHFDDDLLCQLPEERLPANTEESFKSKFRLFPNPMQANLSISYELPFKQNAILEIVNLHGQKVYERILFSENNQINIRLDHCHPGIYFCKVQQDGQLLYQDKIIIQK